jgi:hypothetical protein
MRSLTTILLLGASLLPSVMALCCNECERITNKCIADCVAEGKSKRVCGKTCYGQFVSPRDKISNGVARLGLLGRRGC